MVSASALHSNPPLWKGDSQYIYNVGISINFRTRWWLTPLNIYLSKGSGQNYYTRTLRTVTRQTTNSCQWWCLPAPRPPPCLTSKDGVFIRIAIPLSSSKKLQWAADWNLTFFVCLVMPTLASWIFQRQLKFKSNKMLLVMFEDRWCLWEAPSYPKGGSSSSMVVLTSSLKQSVISRGKKI